jgi:hypothetical protein
VDVPVVRDCLRDHGLPQARKPHDQLEAGDAVESVVEEATAS